jgi:hypothetical protein
MPATANLRVPVSPDILSAMLSPYLCSVHYLQSAVVGVNANAKATDSGGLVVASGEFVSPPEPWYIRDTGHFNAMEFNLCYNQLAYATVAQCVAERLLPALEHMDLAMFCERQLSHMFIASLESRFRRPMRSVAFTGEFILDTAARRNGMILLKTRCSFGTLGKAYSEGSARLVILDPNTSE